MFCFSGSLTSDYSTFLEAATLRHDEGEPELEPRSPQCQRGPPHPNIMQRQGWGSSEIGPWNRHCLRRPPHQPICSSGQFCDTVDSRRKIHVHAVSGQGMKPRQVSRRTAGGASSRTGGFDQHELRRAEVCIWKQPQMKRQIWRAEKLLSPHRRRCTEERKLASGKTQSNEERGLRRGGCRVHKGESKASCDTAVVEKGRLQVTLRVVTFECSWRIPG